MPGWTSQTLPRLRYDEAAFKASHNSYERDERPVTTQFQRDHREPHQAGCRGIELDIHQSRDFPTLWSVNHTGGFVGAVDRQFAMFLELLDRESTARPGHDVMTMTVDLKSVASGPSRFGDDLDSYVAAHFGTEKLFTPKDLKEKFADQRSAGAPEAWPLLRELKGRFVFCLSGKQSWKDHYRKRGGGLCFTDQKADHPDDVGSLGKGPAFYNLNWEKWSRGIHSPNARLRKKYVQALKKLATDSKVVSRAYGLNDKRSWREARSLGVNILSTDKVRKHDWAKVGKRPFARVAFSPPAER